MKRERLGWSWRFVVSILLIGWISIIFGFSSQSYQQQDIKPKLRRWIPQEVADRIVPDISFRYHNGIVSGENPYKFMEFFIRKAAHMFEYGVLGILLYLLLFFIRKTGWRVVGALALTAAAAFTDEWNQSRVANRTSTILDVGVDMLGATLAIGLFLLAYRILWGRIGNKSKR